MTSNNLIVANCLDQQDKLAPIKEMQVLPDFRAPDNIRLSPVLLYASFSDVYTAVSRLQTVITEKRYEKYPARRSLVA